MEIGTAEPIIPKKKKKKLKKRRQGFQPPDSGDDNGGGDLMLLSMATQDCKTMVRGAPAREWVIDWKTIKTLGLQQNFIFVKGDDLQIAIVADTSKADQADKLSELAMAMTNAKRGCQGEYD